MFGRLGSDSERYLDLLASAAEERDVQRAVAPRQRTRAWTTQLSLVLFRATARSLLESTGVYSRTRAVEASAEVRNAGAPNSNGSTERAEGSEGCRGQEQPTRVAP